tara:strand:- start:9939 stop:10895 length:957 start_codon:yes stop_codon:yes gene_type:complete
LNKVENDRLIWISLVAIVVCPALVVVVALSFESLRADLYEVDFLDVFGELLLLILVQFWILTIAFAQLRAATYHYLITGFSIITLANTADLLDEFVLDELSLLNLLENIAYPLGMMITTVGLFKLSRDYRKLISKVNRDRDSWRNKANRDQLTGLLNRRYFFEVMPDIANADSLDKAAPALLMLDIDLFKSVNDQFGHDKGDNLLRSVGECIRKFCRNEDKGFRLGGEEFGILLLDADTDAVLEAAERIRQRISIIQLKTESGELVSRTVSIGVSFLDKNDTLDSWMKKADDALYQAKDQGRNRVIVAKAISTPSMLS